MELYAEIKLRMKYFARVFLLGLHLLGGSFSRAQTQIGWESAPGLEGQNIQTISLDSHNYVFALTGNELFRSTNGGDSWQSIWTSTTYAWCMLIDNDDSILLGLESEMGRGATVIRSTDGGSHWGQLGINVGSPYVRALAYNNDGDLFALTDNGVFRLDHDAQQWTAIDPGLGLWIRCITLNDSGHIFLGTWGGGVYRSVDKGDHWMPFNNGLTQQAVSSLGVDPQGLLYAGTIKGVFRMTNGMNWEHLTQHPNSGVSAITFDSNGLIYTLSGTVYKSSDINGSLWTPIGYGLGGADALVIDSNDRLFAGIAGVGVYRTMHYSDVWLQTNTGLLQPQIGCLTANAAGYIFAGASEYDIGIYRSANNGETWTLANNGINELPPLPVLRLAAKANGDIFAGFSGAGIYRSIDNGEHWVALDLGLGDIYNWIYSIVFNAKGEIYIGTHRGVLRSTDNGDQWETVNTGLPAAEVTTLAINDLDEIFVGLDNGSFWSSADNGETWVPIDLELADQAISVILIKSNREMFLATHATTFPAYQGIYRCMREGETWRCEPLWEGLVNTLIMDANGHIFAGTYDSGVLRSTNNGDTWERFGSLGSANDFALTADGFLFAAAGYVFRTAEPTTSVKQISMKAENFSLSQNYPNPFNPITKIRFAIKHDVHVSLKVYNLIGQEVATLVNERLSERTYEVEWNASGMPSGVYLYRLQAGEFVETKKLMMLK